MIKRIILQLLVDEKGIYLSRGFTKQYFCSIKDVNSLLKLDEMTSACDELLVQYVGTQYSDTFFKSLFSSDCLGGHFIPITCGGRVKDYDQMRAMLRLGADKVVISSSLINHPKQIMDLVDQFGSQAVVYPLQVKGYENIRSKCSYKSRGTVHTQSDLLSVIKVLNQTGVGEIIVYDIERDGSGTGYNEALHQEVSAASKAQVIASGGEGKSSDISSVLKLDISGAAISNLFSFMGGGIQRARYHAIEEGINIVNWS